MIFIFYYNGNIAVLAVQLVGHLGIFFFFFGKVDMHVRVCLISGLLKCLFLYQICMWLHQYDGWKCFVSYLFTMLNICAHLHLLLVFKKNYGMKRLC